MTNEEKAKILVGYDINTPRNLMRLEARDEYDNLLSMAEWKDLEFKAKVKNYINIAYSNDSDIYLLEDLLKTLDMNK